jgi:hypothetical protein
VIILLITAVFVLEYFFYIVPFFKILFVAALALIFSAVFIKYVLGPLMYCVRLKEFSLPDKAQLVTKHFPGLKDQLINIVELGQFDEINDLVISSINQKTDKLPDFCFKSYFSFQLIRKHLVGFCFSLLVSLTVFFTFPALFVQAGYRLVHMGQAFVKPAPFHFVLENSSLQVLKGGSVELAVKCVGLKTPEHVYVNIGGTNFVMENRDSVFVYQLTNVHRSFAVFFTDLQFLSKKYKIEVIPDPLILSSRVTVYPPLYTALPKQAFAEVSDLEVPFGSRVVWDFECSDTDSIFIAFNHTVFTAVKDSRGHFLVDGQIKESARYKLFLQNSFVPAKELFSFAVKVSPDAFPTIDVVQVQDSVNLMQFYFKGEITDDFGFHNLTFNLKNEQTDSVFQLGIFPNNTRQDFYYGIDFNDFIDSASDFSYYFTVRDNDVFHNFKSSTSGVFSFHMPDYQELSQKSDSLFHHVEDLISNSQSIIEGMKRDFNDFKYRSISENLNEWDQQQFMQQMLEKRDQLQNAVKQLVNKNTELNNLNNSFSEQKEELLDKQQQINDLLNDVMTDELKQLFDEFNELAKKFDKERFNGLMNRMDFPLDDLSKQLDRNLELLKRYKIEQGVESIIAKLNEIAEKEAKQAGETNLRNWEQLLDEESANQVNLRDFSNQLIDLQQLNKQLEKPMNLSPLDEEFGRIDNNYEQIKENIQNRKSRKLRQQISQNQEQLLNLSFSLQQMLDNSQVASTGENIGNLKQILKNLVFLSLEQEEILNLSEELSVSDPSLQKVLFSQELLLVQSKQLEDSLYALASRTPAVSSKVNDELSKIKFSLENVSNDLKESDFASAVRFQQNVITSFNELALLLNEALEKLEKMMANSMPGDQECDKPGGGGKSSVSKLKDARKSLKEQLQQMIEGLKNGQDNQVGRQIGKSLMQQEILKNMIGDLLMDESVGSSAKEQLRAVEQLIEQNRRDLLTENLNDNIINRQNLILDRLLKAEKAEIERDLDQDRESKTAAQKFYTNPNPDLLFEYKEKEKNKTEEIRYNSIRMRKFYEDKFRIYINKVNQ